MFGLVFNYWIQRRWGGWWHTYNYITAAALDSGLILSTIVIFFAITLPGVKIPQWWGNKAPFETMVRNYSPVRSQVGLTRKDYLNSAVQRKVVEGETFGPTQW